MVFGDRSEIFHHQSKGTSQIVDWSRCFVHSSLGRRESSRAVGYARLPRPSGGVPTTEPNLPHLLTKHQKPPKPHLTIHTHTSTSPLLHNRATIWEKRETTFKKNLLFLLWKSCWFLLNFYFCICKCSFLVVLMPFFSLGTPIRKLRFFSGWRRGQNGKKLLLISPKEFRLLKKIGENGLNKVLTKKM